MTSACGDGVRTNDGKLKRKDGLEKGPEQKKTTTQAIQITAKKEREDMSEGVRRDGGPTGGTIL